MTVRLTSPIFGLRLNDVYTGPLESLILAANAGESLDLGPVSGSGIVQITGLRSGEVITYISPNAGAYVSPDRTAIVATIDGTYTVYTSSGRILTITLTAGSSTPLRALTFSDNTPLQLSDGQYLELAA